MKPVVVVGAGWSGAVVASRLAAEGIRVEVLERAPVVGGHSRVETLNGVVYEPNGPHIFHTNDEDVARFVSGLGFDAHPYEFCPLTEVDLGDDGTRLMSWPIQVDELEELAEWPDIKRELDELPPEPYGADFETYAVSLMGWTLYRLFVEGYTRKQWGREPSSLSSSFAPKRIDLRRGDYRGLFRDRWQLFPPEGPNAAIGRLLSRCAVTCGADVTLTDLMDASASAFVITAALDDLTESQNTPLEWRGIRQRSRYLPIEDTETPAYVINRPSPRVPYTRTIETKHATGQQTFGTVVSEEYPDADARHYPVDDVRGLNRQANDYLAGFVTKVLAPVPVVFCGRLATYRYINQDEAIADAFRVADEVARSL